MVRAGRSPKKVQAEVNVNVNINAKISIKIREAGGDSTAILGRMAMIVS
jgi:hypothetical protein